MIYSLSANPGSGRIALSDDRRERIESALQKLSSGERINTAADDAAGAAIGDRMSARLKGIDRSIQNIQEAVSMFQEADGGLQQVVDVLQRIRSLALQGGSTHLTDEDRSALQLETDQLAAQIDRTAEETRFNGNVPLLNGGQTLVLQDGPESGNQFVTQLAADVRSSSLGLTGLSLSSREEAMNTLTAVDEAFASVEGQMTAVGGQINRMEQIVQKLSIEKNNMAATVSNIKDADMAEVILSLTREQTMFQSSQHYSVQADRSFRENLMGIIGQI